MEAASEAGVATFFLKTRLSSSANDKNSAFIKSVAELAKAIAGADELDSYTEKVSYFHYTVLAKMDELRAVADEAEILIPDSFLPYPTYDKLLFSV